MTQTDALQKIDSVGPASTEGKAHLLALTRTGAGGEALLSRLSMALAGPLARAADDVELLLAHAQQAWIADQRDPSAARARDSARRLIELVPDLPDGYRLLGFAHLTRREYRDAFLALSAVKTLQTPVNLDNFRALSKFLMTGVTQVSFDLAQQRYTFDLTTHNAAAVEASAFHSVGILTEWEELQYLAEVLGKPQRIAEIGVLVGNHTAFFLKTFTPSHLTVIDADPANLPFIRGAIAHNSVGTPQVTVHNAFVGGAATDAVAFAGTTVPQRPLSDLIEGSIDFLKIDVDGGEVALLSGAASVIDVSRPSVMIETTPTTHEAVVAWFTDRMYAVKRVFDRGGYRNVVLTP